MWSNDTDIIRSTPGSAGGIWFGQSCALSADGLTAIAFRTPTHLPASAWIWTGIDNGERGQMGIDGSVYASAVPVEASGSYQVIMAAKDVTGNVGFGELVSGVSAQGVDRSVQGVPANSSLPMEKLEFVFDFDSDDATEYTQYIGKVILSNGDAFYGPRYGYTNSYNLTSVGNFTNGGVYPYTYSINNDMASKYDNDTLLSRAWVFYYEPSKPSLINKVKVQLNTFGGNNKEYITKIGKVSTTNEFESATNIYLDGSAISLEYSTRVTNDFVVTFDAILAGPNEPVKLVLAQNNNTLKNLNEVTFEFEGDVSPSPTFPSLSTLNTSITSAAFDESGNITLSGEVTASETEGATTSYKALATTQTGLSNTQVRNMMNNAEYADAVLVNPVVAEPEQLLPGDLESGTQGNWIIGQTSVSEQPAWNAFQLRHRNGTGRSYSQDHGVAGFQGDGATRYMDLDLSNGEGSEFVVSKIRFWPTNYRTTTTNRMMKNVKVYFSNSTTFSTTPDFDWVQQYPNLPLDHEPSSAGWNDYLSRFGFEPSPLDDQYTYTLQDENNGYHEIVFSQPVNARYVKFEMEKGNYTDNVYGIHALEVYAFTTYDVTLTNLSIPKVLDANNQIVPAESVNYANVYLYGTDGTLANDAMAVKTIEPTFFVPGIALDSSAQGVSANSGLTQTLIDPLTDNVFDYIDNGFTVEPFITSHAQYGWRHLGQVTLSNGDKLYGPTISSGSGTVSVGHYSNNSTYPVYPRPNDSNNDDKYNLVSLGKSPSDSRGHGAWVFYYEPSVVSSVNKVTLTFGARHGIEYVFQVGSVSVDGVFESATNVSVNNNAVSVPYQLPTGNSITVTFDAIQIGPNNPVKYVHGQNNDGMQLSDIKFECDSEPVPVIENKFTSRHTCHRVLEQLR